MQIGERALRTRWRKISCANLVRSGLGFLPRNFNFLLGPFRLLELPLNTNTNDTLIQG